MPSDSQTQQFYKVVFLVAFSPTYFLSSSRFKEAGQEEQEDFLFSHQALPIEKQRGRNTIAENRVKFLPCIPSPIHLPLSSSIATAAVLLWLTSLSGRYSYVRS